MGNLHRIQKKIEEANGILFDSHELLTRTRIAIKNQNNETLRGCSDKELKHELNERMVKGMKLVLTINK